MLRSRSRVFREVSAESNGGGDRYAACHRPVADEARHTSPRSPDFWPGSPPRRSCSAPAPTAAADRTAPTSSGRRRWRPPWRCRSGSARTRLPRVPGRGGAPRPGAGGPRPPTSGEPDAGRMPGACTGAATGEQARRRGTRGRARKARAPILRRDPRDRHDGSQRHRPSRSGRSPRGDPVMTQRHVARTRSGFPFPPGFGSPVNHLPLMPSGTDSSLFDTVRNPALGRRTLRVTNSGPCIEGFSRRPSPAATGGFVMNRPRRSAQAGAARGQVVPPLGRVARNGEPNQQRKPRPPLEDGPCVNRRPGDP